MVTVAARSGVLVEGVLFDLDDTLFDHRGAADRGVRTWLAGLGLDGPLDEHVERWVALEVFHHERFQRREISHQEQRRARIRAFLASRDLADDELADDTFAGYLSCYRAAWSAFRDAGAALARAIDAGLAVGILTNGDQSQQEEKVRRTALGSYEVPVFASSSLPAAKPDPRAFHAAAGRLGVDPAACVMVGDSLAHDVRGALGAGLAAVLVDRYGRYDDLADAELAGVVRVRTPAELDWS